MRPISDNARELIHQLLDRPSLGVGFFGPRVEREGLLARIGAAGDPAAIPYLVPLALSGERVAGAAASALARLVETVPPPEVIELDRWLRGSGPFDYGAFQQWDQLLPADLFRIDRHDDGWAVRAIAACHRNGRVREAAIRLLSVAPDGRALPFLILRLNDWADPVRQATETAIEGFLESPDPDALISSLPLLLRMPSWKRRNHRPFLERVQELLQQPFARDALAQGRESGDRRVRRECYRLSLGVPDLDLTLVAERGLDDSDILVRLQAVRLLRRMDDETLRRFVDVARTDGLMAVRREALEIAVSRFPREAIAWLRIALLDSHGSVRELARSRLGQRAEAFNVREFYREAVRANEGRGLRAALLGLQEVGAREDACLALPLCWHPQPKIREAAVRAAARLDYETNAGVILQALSDESPRVSKRAAMVLREKRIFSVTAQIWECVRSDQQPKHVRLRALHLLGSLSKWVLLPFLVQASALAEADVACAAREQVELWLAGAHSSFVKPTAEQADEILRTLRQAEETLGLSLAERIRSEVRFWRGLG